MNLGNVTSYTLTGLKVGVKVNVRIRSKRVVNGANVWSSPSGYATGNSRPNILTGFKFTKTAAGTATMTWTATSAVDGYLIQVSTDNGLTWNEGVNITTVSQNYWTDNSASAKKRYRLFGYVLVDSKPVYSASSVVLIKP